MHCIRRCLILLCKVQKTVKRLEVSSELPILCYNCTSIYSDGCEKQVF